MMIGFLNLERWCGVFGDPIQFRLVVGYCKEKLKHPHFVRPLPSLLLEEFVIEVEVKNSYKM